MFTKTNTFATLSIETRIYPKDLVFSTEGQEAAPQQEGQEDAPQQEGQEDAPDNLKFDTDINKLCILKACAAQQEAQSIRPPAIETGMKMTVLEGLLKWKGVFSIRVGDDYMISMDGHCLSKCGRTVLIHIYQNKCVEKKLSPAH